MPRGRGDFDKWMTDTSECAVNVIKQLRAAEFSEKACLEAGEFVTAASAKVMCAALDNGYELNYEK